MRRSSIPFFLACFAVLAGPIAARAQLDCVDPDLVAVVFDNGDINYSPPLFIPFNARLVLLNPAYANLDAFEVLITIPAGNGNLVHLGDTYPVNALNIGNTGDVTHMEFWVGFATPVPPNASGDIVLTTISLMPTAQGSNVNIYLQPTSIPSLPGDIAYNTTDVNGSYLHPMHPISGSFSTPVARLWPVTPLVFCQSSVSQDFTVTIVGEGETLVAGAAVNATDARDLGIDIADTTPLLTFPRPEWGVSPSNFERDIRAYYDPTAAVKTWTFTASPAVLATADYQVDLSFTSTLDATSGADLKLRDRVTNSTIDLRTAGMAYSYVDAASRTFDLYIGTEAAPLPAIVVDIGATCGQYSDALTRAATLAQATDGFDGDFDFPEPSPPPGGYLAVSFEHTNWPLGPRFSTDVRALFDPTASTAVWPLMVESDLSGPVILTFSPNFAATAGYGLQLRDLYTQQTFNLFPSLTYVYTNYGSATTRRFELVIGADEPPVLVPASRPLPAGWSMVGLPLAPLPGAATVGAVMLDPSPGYAYAFTHHRLLGYQSVAATATAAQGKGYWLGTSAPFDWTMTGTMDLDGVDVALVNGWNLVGNANWFPGPFEGLQVVQNGVAIGWLAAVANGLVSADVQAYDHTLSIYYDAVDLQPWHGYWINALADDLTLRFHWRNFMDLPARLSSAPPAAKSLPGVSWRSDLVLTDAEGHASAITYGVDEAATHGFDALFDRPLPPAAPGGGTTLSFQHPEWELAAGSGFTRDVVGPGEDPVRWAVALSAPVAGEATLSWDPKDWPQGVDYQLYFPHENRVVVMSMRDRTSLAVDVGPQPLTVVVRTPDMTSGVGEPAEAGEYALSAQPNPFNPSTTVSFNLPSGGTAEVRIYTLRGELVAVLGGREYEAGRHQETWRGRDRAGREVPSGAYFGRLHVGGRAEGPVVRLSLVR